MRPAAGTLTPAFSSRVGPDAGMAPLVAGDALECRGPFGILLHRGQAVVKHDRVALELQVREAARALVGVQLERGWAMLRG